MTEHIGREIAVAVERIASIDREVHTKIEALDRLVHTELSDHAHALKLAASGTDSRLENIYTSLDRIRDSLNTMLPRDIYDDRHNTLDARISLLERSYSRSNGIAAGVVVALGLLVGGFVALALHLFG